MSFFSVFHNEKAVPEPRLLPLDAYPDHLDEAARDRADQVLREQMHTIPTEPDEYFDNEGAWWTLAEDGSWTDTHGQTRSSLYAPAVSMFGPFTRAKRGAAEDVDEEVPAHG
jgi:hypothetical protein